LLDAVAQRAQLTLREMDLLARYDEGEFMVMLACCNRREAAKVAGRVQDSIAEGYDSSNIAHLPLSARFGIAQLDRNESAEALLARASQALDSSNAPDDSPFAAALS
jgi:diguanylate cyclase (GGDEF)-like protein